MLIQELTPRRLHTLTVSDYELGIIERALYRDGSAQDIEAGSNETNYTVWDRLEAYMLDKDVPKLRTQRVGE